MAKTPHKMPNGMISSAQKYKKLCTMETVRLKKIM